MKTVIDYSENELNILTKEELEALLKEAEDGETLYNTQQIVAKTSINSLN